MMRTRAAVAIILVLGAAAVVAYFGWLPVRANATSSLRHAYESAHRTDYAGKVTTTVYYCGREISIRSGIRHNGPEERIEYLSGPLSGVVVVARGGETRTYRPNTRQILVSRAASRRSEGEELELLLRNYAVLAAGEGRVAGRPVNIVDLTSKHPGNPSKRLWIDRETGIVLKSEDRSAAGELRSRMEFTEISYGKPAAGAAFEPTADGGPRWVEKERDHEISRAELEKAVGIKVAFPQHVPAGYVLDSITLYSCECECGHKAAHLRYTDGLNSISIYETPSHTSCSKHICSIHCAPNGRCEVRDARQARVATTSSGGRSVVVVGDLPEEEIAKVAKSIR